MSQKIPLYTQTSYDWHCDKNQQNKPYAVDLNVGTNEYIFGRTTPDNNFIVSTGLINDPKPLGIQMIGGLKKKSKKGGSQSTTTNILYDSSIYNEQNYANNELIYNALTKSAEIKGINGTFVNSMIDAQNNIIGGGKLKKKSSSKTKTTTTKPKTKTTTTKPKTKTTTTKPKTKTTTSKPKTKTTTSKPKTKTTKSFKNKIVNFFK